MKRFYALFVLFLLLSCAAKNSNAQPTAAEIRSDCPKTGTCTFQLLPNKSLVVSPQDNRLRYTLAEHQGTQVIIFTYNRTVKGDVQDASYREEVVFETKQQLDKLTLVDAALQSTNMLFGRFCYCKGQTGYYKVHSGKLLIDSGNLTLNFTISEVPQIINQIQLSIK